MARDVIMIGVLLFALALGFFVIHFTVNTALDAMIDNPQINESSAAVSALQETKDLTNRLDYILFVVFIGMTLALIITGWFIGGHAIFMFVYFVFVVLAVVFATFFANIWDTFSQASVFGLTIAAFPLTSHILSNMPIYMAIIGGIGILVMFAKPYFFGGEQW